MKTLAACLLITLCCASAASAQTGSAQETNQIALLSKEMDTLFQTGRYQQAIPIAQQLLKAREDLLGPEHPDTATSLTHLGVLYEQVGNYAKAEPLFQRALRIREKVLGPEDPGIANSLNDLAALYWRMGDYAKAEPLLQRVLKIREKALGPEHPDTAMSLNNLASVYEHMGDYVKAEVLYQRALRIREKALGPEHPDTAISLNNLASVYEHMGDYAKAEVLYQRALRIREKALGPEHPDTATALNNLAHLYWLMGDYTKAEPLLQRGLRIQEKALGPEHPDTATSLNILASVYEHMDDYAKAEPLYQRALRIQEKVLGPEHPDTATALNNLAHLYWLMGDYAKAEPLFQRALKIREKALGPEHRDTAQSLNNLASVYDGMGHYAKAEPLLQRALSIREKALGPEHPDTATSLNILASVYEHMDDYAKAEPLFQRALRIREKALGPEHPDTATSLNNLASVYGQMGDYAKAEPLYQRALRIREKALGPEHPDTATSLNNLASVYGQMGDYAKAEPLYQRALRIREKALGPEHSDTATALSNLAALYWQMGDYAKAEPLHQRALRIREKAQTGSAQDTNNIQALDMQLESMYRAGSYQQAIPIAQQLLKACEEAVGPENPATAKLLNKLAELYRQTGDYAKAEPLCQRALSIQEKVLGPEHPDTAQSLNNLGSLYWRMDDYAKAEPLFQRALKIQEKVLGPEHPHTAAILDNLAALYQAVGDYAKAEPLYQRALRIQEKVLGPEHPDTAATLTFLGFLYHDQGSQPEAEAFAANAAQARLKGLANILAFTSEQQRLAYQAYDHPCSLFATLGNALGAATAMLENKGVVLDSLAEDRLVAEASQNPEDRAAIDRIRQAKQRLAQLTLEVPRDLSDEALGRRRAEREKLSSDVEELEGQMARRFASLGRARRALSVTVEQVQAALPSQTALVELLRYNHYLGKNKQQRYGAAVVMPSGEPKWVCLGSAADIEKNIKTCQQAVRSKTAEKELAANLQALYQRLWSPVETTLPAGTTTIILSPDAQLNFVSFATLLAPDGQFLGQKYSLRYVASGRDLLRELKPGATSDLWVYANPDFSGRGVALARRGDTEPASLAPVTNHAPRITDQVALRSVEMSDMQSLYLPPLPGTARESEALAAEARKASWPLHVFVGAEATEAQLKAVQSPHILHLATHGFFLPETESEKPDVGSGFRGIGGLSSGLGGGLLDEADRPAQRPVFLKNPMHRSGLALAGAQATLEAWKRGEVPPMDNDGIVTAEEVGGLKLEGTWLVVLSACDTGLGVATSGEGVLGLRRGFVQAGAQNLLMTLWSVPDEETVKLMVEFYVAAQKSGNAPQALAEVQRGWLVKLRQERGLSDAVRIAGPFIMTSQGPVK